MSIPSVLYRSARVRRKLCFACLRMLHLISTVLSHFCGLLDVPYRFFRLVHEMPFCHGHGIPFSRTPLYHLNYVAAASFVRSHPVSFVSSRRPPKRTYDDLRESQMTDSRAVPCMLSRAFETANRCIVTRLPSSFTHPLSPSPCPRARMCACACVRLRVRARC